MLGVSRSSGSSGLDVAALLYNRLYFLLVIIGTKSSFMMKQPKQKLFGEKGRCYLRISRGGGDSSARAQRFPSSSELFGCGINLHQQHV